MVMYNISDRVPQNPNQWTLKKADGSTETVTLTRNDNPVNEGTPINRETLMGVQGFVTTTTKFNADGSITEENATGTVTTKFNSDGSITETFLGTDGQQIIKTTTFLSDGSISEVIS